MTSQVCVEQSSTKAVQLLTKQDPRPLSQWETSNAADATGELAGLLQDDALAKLDGLTQLDVRLGPATDSNLYAGFSQQVMGGGVFISTHQYLSLMHEYGTRVAVTLRFPGGLKTRVLGKVQFARDPRDVHAPISPGLGIKFLALTDDGHQLINQFAAEREPLFFTE